MSAPRKLRPGPRNARAACLGLCALLAAPLALAQQAGSAGAPEVDADAESAGAPEQGGSPVLSRSRWSTGDDAAALGPMGLTDTRTLDRGEWAFSYRYWLIHQDDMRDGTHRVDTDEVLQRFEQTPRKRDTHVHLLGVSYAPHRRVTVSAKLPVITQKTHANAGGPPTSGFETESSGVGDLELRALVPFMRKRGESLQIEMGLSAPTGDIRERDRGADGTKARLPFPQQLGSGTVDLLPGLVYRGRWETLSWGFVARATFRVYENANSDRFGNEYLLSTWLAQSWTDWMSTSLRLSWQRHGAIYPEKRTTVNPEADPKRQAGEFLDLGPGVNFRVPFLGGPRFGVEMTWPFYQTLEGPQLERDWQLSAGFQWAF